MHWKPRSQTSIDADARRLRKQRALNPVREARRQHLLSRAAYPTMLVPTYKQIISGDSVTAQVYVGHKPTPMPRGRWVA